MTVTLCEHCGQPLGAPHTLLESDCILRHPDHAERFVGMLCKRHYHWIDSSLVQIEELFALRDLVLIPGPGGGGRSATRIGSPAPGRLDVMALTDRRAKTPIDLDDDDDVPDLPGALTSWALAVVEERQATDDLNTVAAAIRVLRRERKWVAAQPWVDDYASEIGALHLAVARAVGDSMWPKAVGVCPNCGAKLYNTIGVDEVTCGRCRSSWTGIALARLRLIHEQEAG